MMDAGNEKVALRSRIAELEVENALLRQREKERLKASQQELRLDQHLRNLGTDFQDNIASLVKLCGDFLGGACSFYNRLRGDKLTPCGQWNIPPGFNPGVGLMARLCRDLIHGGEEKFLYIPCLDDIPCTETEFDNHGAGFKTFLGCVVGYGNTSVGALCVLYRKHYILTEQDQRIMTIIATVIADEDRRNEAAKALRESEERFRGLVNGTHDIVYAINADGCCTFIGPQVSRYGFTPDELLGRNFLDLILAEDRELLEADFKKTRNLSQSYSQMVFRKILRDGRIVWLENTGTSLYDDAGRFSIEIGTLRDITERKRMEDALRKAEENFRSIFENAVEGIFRTNTQGRYMQANPALARIYGFESPAELMRHYDDISRQLYVEAGRREEFIRLLGDKEAIFDFESAIRRKDGSVI